MITTTRKLNIMAWTLSVVVSLLALIVWGNSVAWRLLHLGSYRLFPLLGLLAFSLMWAHYVMSATRQYLEIDKTTLQRYFELTSLVVLVALVMHPGLLVWQLWRDGFGLPPTSYLQHYVVPSLRWAALLGSVSFFFFIAYEFRRRFAERNWWWIVKYGTDAAMIAVFVHGLKLGSHLQTGWFRAVWYFYGLTLICSLVYIYHRRFRRS